MNHSPDISAAMEDYLEAIFRLIAEKGAARVGDIASALAVHKSTVTGALKKLAQAGLVSYSPYERTTLTATGRQAAQRIAQRHATIKDVLVHVFGLPPDRAESNACRMEHVLDSELMNRFEQVADFARACPEVVAQWRSRLDESGQAESHTTKETQVTLKDLKPGERAVIVRVGSVGALKRRILDMGVVRGAPVEVVKIAPLGDPIEVKVKGYHLTLRKEEAKAIDVERE